MKRSQDILYSIKSEVHIRADSYRISKFTDGELESSYQTTFAECDCPAGVRPSCRHRQMLPQMIAADIVNTQFFWNFDLGRAVDFSGTLKSNIDAMNELANLPDVSLDIINAVNEYNAEDTVGEAQHSEPQLSGLQEEMILMGFHQPELCKPEAQHVEGNPTPTLSSTPKPFVRRL